METIRGRKSLELDISKLTERLAGYNQIILDLGTGDGRYVRSLAGSHPDRFIIGIDACRENLREHSQPKLPNMLFVIASAQDLPDELNGLVSHITINFPWGSLLESLLSGDPELLGGLSSIARKNARLEIYLNSGALAEQGVDLEGGAGRIQENLLNGGWQGGVLVPLKFCDLQKYPTTWARRLAHGRDPRAMAFSSTLVV